jgi:uncharacterized repeat protein (TIGR03803 family)
VRSRQFSIALTTALTIFMASLFVTVTCMVAQEKVLHSFDGTNGSSPFDGLVFDAEGNLYGTTELGGTGLCAVLGEVIGCGTVLELSPKTGGGWTVKVLHNFIDNGGGGNWPYAGLILDAAGNLYGTTQQGGAFGGGAVFELTRTAVGGWAEKVLYSFDYSVEGCYPQGSLVFDAAGNLYGTTEVGGPNGYGTVFELAHEAGGSWTETILHGFSNKDGSGFDPIGGLVFDAAGNLYGTTYGGGAYGTPDGGGTAFELSPKPGGGWTEKVLHNFGKGADGSQPHAGLIFDAAGNLYGTTLTGGAYGHGTAFELSRRSGGAWTEKVLHNFNDNSKDGFAPSASLIPDGAGNLYGTTANGGPSGFGTVFEVTP